MNENIAEDVLEVKRRLEFIGRSDVDEAVICDLLNSYHTDSPVDSVMDIILSTSHNSNSTVTDSEGSDVIVPINVKPEKETKKDDCSIEDYVDLSMDNMPIELGDTTDTEDDDDTYYNHGNWDDISYIDNASRSLSPVLMNVCDDSEAPRQVANELANTTDEILEENNNDPNNNMESIERHEEEPTCSSNIESEPYQETTMMQVDSPQPGCSKDMDRDEYVEDDKLRKEALKICDVLVNVGYTLVYDTLLKNARADNRIELTIWDLLPDKRPDPQYALKRKYIEVDNVIEETSTSANACIPKDNNLNNQDGISTSCEEPKKESFKKLFNPFNSTSKTILFSTPNKLNNIWNTTTKQITNTKEENNIKSILAPVISSVSSNDIKLKKPELISSEGIISSSSVFKENSSLPKFNLLRQPMLSLLNQNSSNQQPAPYIGNQQLTFNITNNQTANHTYKTLLLKQNQLKQLTNFAKNQINLAPHRNTVIRPSRLICNTSLPQVINKGASSSTTMPTSQILPNKSCIIRLAEMPTKGTDPTQITPIATSNSMFFNLNNKSYCLLPVGKKNKNDKTSLSQIADCSAIPSTSKAFSSTLPSTVTIEESHPTSSSSVSTSSSTDLSHMVATTSTDVSSILPSKEKVNSVIHLEEVSSCVSSQFPDESKKPLKTTQKQSERASRIADQLISMFPQFEADYVKQICCFNVENLKGANDIELLNRLTEHLLQKGETLPSVKETVSEEIAIEEQYANLIGIFPDADPTYLRQTAEELHKKPEELRQFIQCKLENRNYPTREQYYAKQKITEQQKQYTTDFNIKQFLEIFPDPFKYFEDPDRQCKLSTDALEFLKFHFNRTKVTTIRSHYVRNKHHLTLTAKALEQLSPDVKSKRSTKAAYTPQNIPLLQEIAFIVHKKEITKYLEDVRAKELEEFLAYKRNNALLHCQCCYDDECMPSKCSRCENNHVFCNTCIVRGTEAKLANGQNRIGCFTECTSEFSLSVLQRVLPPTKFSIILRQRQEAEIMAAGLEGLVSCPFCHFASIPPPEDKIFKCLNPECMKETCRLCQELNHVPLKCEEAKSDKARLYLEEKMTEALVRKCYSCGRPFFKEDGCNKIYCVCGAMMCYICDKPIKGYDHFNQGNPARSTLCPLWSDNRTINAAAVTKVAQDTIKHIHQQDPNVRLTTKGLLPGVPQRNNGQLEPGHNSTTLPARAYKIARFDL